MADGSEPAVKTEHLRKKRQGFDWSAQSRGLIKPGLGHSYLRFSVKASLKARENNGTERETPSLALAFGEFHQSYF